MIICKKCETENPLGTLFCRGCGERLEIEVHDVMGAVKAERHLQLELRTLGAAKNAANLALFALVISLCVSWFVVPEIPRGQIAYADPRSAEVLFPAIEAAPADAGNEIDLVLERSDSTLDWRRHHAEALLSAAGLDLEALRELQGQIVAQQRDDGSFRGLDQLAATALATLALQAYPGEPAIDEAATKGRSWLVDHRRDAISGGGGDVLVLWGAVQLEAGSLSARDRSLVISALGTGDLPRLHAAMLPLFDIDERRGQIVVLERDLRGHPAWRRAAAIASGETLADSDLPADWSALDALDRWAVAQAAWWRPADLARLTGHLQAWTEAAFADPVAGFSSRYGPQGLLALKLLTVTAPARVPIAALPNPRADPSSSP